MTESKRLALDLNDAVDTAVGAGGLTSADFARLRKQYVPVVQALAKRAAAGQLGYTKLPGDKAALDAAVSLGRDLRGSYDTLVVMGIGGSSLGAKAVFSGLTHPFHNQLPADKRGGMRIYFPDNSDPATFSALLDTLDLKRTAFAAVTKSGGTAETLSQLAIVRHRIKAELGAEAVKKQIVAVTDPASGALRGMATTEGWRTLPVPPDVGGRFSVLTACGTLPAVCAGINVPELMEGAASALTYCLPSSQEEKSPAAMLASVLHMMDSERKRPIHVLMPYADALRETGAWYVQLWAESLGKQRNGESVGPTPMGAVGATDQHSFLQLMMQGPQDKFVTFVMPNERRVDLVVPPEYPNVPEMAYLSNIHLSKLIDTEWRATASALAARGRPSATLRIPRVDAFNVGAMLMFFEVATSVAGELYGINTYDQPGVELGKRYACGILGRPGYEDAAKELAGRPQPRPEFVLA